MPSTRVRSIALSGLVAVAVAAVTVGFLQLRERSCDNQSAGECLGAGLVEWLLTLVAAYVVWAVALRVCRVALPWLAPLAVAAAVAAVVAPLDPPLWAAVAVVGVLGAAWGAIPGPSRRPAAG